MKFSSLCRLILNLLPVQARPVSTFPTQAEARALGALLISRDRRAVIYPAAHGYTVAEVTR